MPLGFADHVETACDADEIVPTGGLGCRLEGLGECRFDLADPIVAFGEPLGQILRFGGSGVVRRLGEDDLVSSQRHLVQQSIDVLVLQQPKTQIIESFGIWAPTVLIRHSNAAGLRAVRENRGFLPDGFHPSLDLGVGQTLVHDGLVDCLRVDRDAVDGGQ